MLPAAYKLIELQELEYRYLLYIVFNYDLQFHVGSMNVDQILPIQWFKIIGCYWIFQTAIVNYLHVKFQMIWSYQLLVLRAFPIYYILTFFFLLCSSDKKGGYAPQPRFVKERFRPVPLCAPILLPTPHALVNYFPFEA